MISGHELYPKVVEISEGFLGPAGERFIRRQVETHLAIKPENITAQHLPQLVDWIRLMFAMLTSDQKVVDDFSSQLLELANSPAPESAPSLRR